MVRFFIGMMLLVGSSASTAADEKPAVKVEKAPKKFIVNIDNPSFRKLTMAIPTFTVDPAAADNLKKLSQEGAKELGRLLTFSGFFAIVEELAYEGVNKKGKQNPKAKRLVDGVDLVPWKALGIETLTLASLQNPREGMQLEIKTIDIVRGEIVLGKRYSKIKPEEFSLVMRRYADRLLEAMTGKPGIFSSKIVFVGRRKKTDNKQIFVCDFDGSNVIQISKVDTTHLSPSWSFDGRFLSFTSYEDGNPDLWVYEMANGRKRKLSGHKGLNSGSSWAPNGKLLVYTGSVKGDADIYMIPFNGGKRKALIRGTGLEVDPVISADAKSLAFVSGRYGKPHIFVASLDWDSDASIQVKNEKRITYAGWYNSTPDWSPDGKMLVFAGYDKEIDRYDVFLVDPTNIQKLDRLTIKAGDNENPTWSPNGQMIVFQSDRTNGRDVKGRKQLYVMNRDGGSQRMIVTGLYDAQTPMWGPPQR